MKKNMKRPNYLIARELILEMLRKERPQIGEAIPSVSKLAQVLNIGRMSIQQAVAMLAKEGILENIPGSGCYIKKIPDTDFSRQKQDYDEAGLKDYLAGPGLSTARKRIRIGILSEMPLFSNSWKKVFLKYMTMNEDVLIELVEIGDIFDLINGGPHIADILQVPAYLLPYLVTNKYLFDVQKLGGIELSQGDFYSGLIEGASYENKIWGVPLIASTICQFYNKNYQTIIRDIFPARGFWKYMEKLRRTSKKTKFRGFESLIVNNHFLFIFFLLAGTEKNPSYGEMKEFENPKYVEFTKNFERYFRDKRIFYQGIDIHSWMATEAFLNNKAIMLMGNSSSIGNFQKNCPFDWGIISECVETDGAIQLNTNLNTISIVTPYPEECLEILKYLSSYEVQRFWAESGRTVANRKANAHLKIKGLDEESLENLFESLSCGKVIRTSDIHIDEYIRTIVNYEMKQWQRGAHSGEELIKTLKRKTDFSDESKVLEKVTRLESFRPTGGNTTLAQRAAK